MNPDKKLRIAINGFGRIGRYTAKIILQNPMLSLVAINDLADKESIAHLLKYDSIHGKWNQPSRLQNDELLLGGQVVKLLKYSNPDQLPWRELDVDIVLECTGRFTQRQDAELHLKAGAKKVILSAPAQDDSIKMIVMGVNESILLGNEKILSNASCTTNCLAPMVAVLHKHFGLQKGYASTVHSYTNDQNLHDAPHRDLRRARAAAYSIIPTSTHAGIALDRILPDLAGKIEASAMRVPVPDGSLTDLVVQLSKSASIEAINAAFEWEAAENLSGILQVTHDPIVSIDIIGNPHSCILDASLTAAQGDLIKIIGWYDNEAGYSNRLVDLIRKISV